MALKALYLCQNEKQFGKCGKLAGYLAGRVLNEDDQTEAKSMIKDAREKTLAPPGVRSFSTLDSMSSNQFEADTEDIFPNETVNPLVDTSGKNRLAAVKSGVWRYQPCKGQGEGYINSEPTKNCRANPLAISPLTYKFLNANAQVHFKGLTDEGVCEHYRQRFEHQIRRTVFKELKCETGLATSIVKLGDHDMDRQIKFGKDGDVVSIELRQSHIADSASIFDFKNGQPTKFSTSASPTRFDAANLSRGHAYYSELARLKLEVKEIVSCCLETDAAQASRCRAGFSGPTPPVNR